MKNKALIRMMAIGAAVGSMGFVSGCIVDARPRPVVYQSVPAAPVAQEPVPDGAVVAQPLPDQVEVVPVNPPAPDVVWIGGFYFWSGGRYAWRPGYWGHPPYRGASWQRGGWVHVRGGVRYAPGRWR